jgi:hypothetical protein
MTFLFKTTILICVMFLTILYSRQLLFPAHVEAARHYRYLVATVPSGWPQNSSEPSAQTVLDKLALEGWELVSVSGDGKTLFLRK